LFFKPSTASTGGQLNQFELNVARLNKMLQSIAGFPNRDSALKSVRYIFFVFCPAKVAMGGVPGNMNNYFVGFSPEEVSANTLSDIGVK